MSAAVPVRLLGASPTVAPSWTRRDLRYPPESAAAGRPVSTIPAACLPPPSPVKAKAPSPDLGACMASRGIREAITYQPASRYWRFQLTETAIYLALALALAGSCFQRLNRRRS